MKNLDSTSPDERLFCREEEEVVRADIYGHFQGRVTLLVTPRNHFQGRLIASPTPENGAHFQGWLIA